MPLKLAVVGCGRWGGFHLWYAHRIGFRVTGWEPPGNPGFHKLIETRRNKYLEIPDGVSLTENMDDIRDSDIIVVSVPAQEFRGVCRSLSSMNMESTYVVLCMKGIERGTGLRLSQVAAEEGLSPAGLSVWVGPGHPQQFLEGVPSCMIVASETGEDGKRMASLFGSDLIRFYWSGDLVGCEIGAATKNVVGIAAGLLDGMGYSGLKGALMARAPLEVSRLVAALGGDWKTVYGLSHLGDYEATLFSPFSHNRRYGEELAGGRRMDRIKLAEGVETTYATMELAERVGVEMPIVSMVKRILDGETTVGEAISELFSRPEREEFPDDIPGIGG